MRPEIVPFISAMGWAVDSIMVRKGARTSSVLSAAFLSYVVTTVLMWSYVAINFPLSIVRSPAAFYFMASGTLQPLLARIFLYIGIDRLGVARAMPLRGVGPLFSVAIAVVFLHERPVVPVYLGALFIVAGGWLVLYRKEGASSDWRLLDAVYPLLAAFLAGVSQNFRKAGLLILPNPFVAGAVTTGTSLAIFVVYLGLKRQFSVVIPSRQSLPYFGPTAFISAISQLLVFTSLSLGDVSVMIPLLNTTPLFSLILSLIFLKDLERVTVPIVLGALSMLGGVTLIATR
ncbi:MAG: DMT family transporter [Deltaproteobacteria bacterium]|nr:DMT family transporter [Deltaproteobacteria bacterium]